MGKERFIDQLKEGDRLDDLFLVKAVRVAETKAGKSYLILTVGDRSGELSGPVWDNVETFQKICQPGEFIQLTGSIQSFRDKLQLKVEMIREALDGQVDLADFVVASSRDPEQMAEEVQRLVRSIKNPFLKKLLNHFLSC